ncbi:MAG: hypothetical protein QOI30_1770, partial [Mycobacterium sp.]|nr:hypothetical protein [Mycobacterium sp.]
MAAAEAAAVVAAPETPTEARAMAPAA